MSTHIHVFPNAIIYKGKNIKLDSIDMPIEQARTLRLETMSDGCHPETPYKIMATNEDGSYFFAEYESIEALQKDRQLLFDDLKYIEEMGRNILNRKLF